MRFIRLSALSAFLILAGCAAPSAPPVAAPPPATPAIDEAEVGLFADLLRREDLRQYDSAAFHGFLAHPSEKVRALGARALGRIGNTAAVGPLVAALNDSSSRVRAEAAFALGELADTTKGAEEALARVLQNPGEDAVEAVAALGKLRSFAARHYLEHVLSTNAQPAIVQEALLGIWRFLRTPETTQLILRHTQSPDEQVKWRATYALTRGLADPAVVPRLIEQLRAEGATYAASFAARGLRAATADSAGMRAEALQVLLSRINDPYAPVRINAIVAIAGYRDSTVAAQLYPLLQHADINPRVAAAQTLGALGGAQTWAMLEAVVRNLAERPVVRGAALNALTSMSGERAVPLITALAGEPQWLSRLYAARAAGAAPSASVLSILRTLAADRDARVSVAALEAAAGARDTLPAARALFIEQLAAADPFARAAALNGLARYADTADQIVLFDAYARAQRDTVPEAAVAALDAIAWLVQRNPAVDRAFRVRFTPGADCPHPDVRAALQRHFQIQLDCAVAPAISVYEEVARNFLLPGLAGGTVRARFTTAGKVIEVDLLPADAPMTVRNFVRLADRGYYNGTRWHRVVPNFVIQDGDPFGNGSGGPGYAIRDEMNRIRYLEGTMGMALSGPDTGGSQFFITHSPQPHLDGGYTVFGRVANGMDAVFAIAQDDSIERIEIVR